MNSNLADWQICTQCFKWPTSLSVWFTVRRLGRLFMALVIIINTLINNNS